MNTEAILTKRETESRTQRKGDDDETPTIKPISL